MQPFEQQPNDASEQTAGEVEEQQAFQPLYEFPPDGPLMAPQPAPVTRVLPEGELEHLPLEEAIRQGLVYPPPPSYYQNMSASPEHAPLPPSPQRASERPTPAPGGFDYASQRQTPQGRVQTYPPPGVYSPYMSQPPVKKSRKWLWILITTLSVIVLASCGLCGWAFYNIFSATYQQVSGSLEVVNDYYTDLQSRNYGAAYSDLSINGLTQDTFTKQATVQDTQDGPVLSFVAGQPSFRTDPNTGGPDLSRFSITVDVKRTHSSYTVLLNLSNIGGSWKITYYDRL